MSHDSLPDTRLPDFQFSGFQFQCRTKTGWGRQALAHLPFDLAAMNGAKPMVIQDNAADRAGLARVLTKAFCDSGMTLGISPPLPEAPDHTQRVNFIKSMYGIYREKGYDCLVALGGDRAADTAKALNITVTLGPEALTEGSPAGHLTPLVYLPTGVDTGTASAGLCRFNGRSLHSSFLAPDQVLMDPGLFIPDGRETLLDSALASLAAGCQAFAQSKNPPCRAYAAAVIRLVMPVLKALTVSGLDPGDNLAQRKKEEKQWQHHLVQAAVFTGYLMTGPPAGLHSMGQAMADKSRLTPGLAMMLLLPRVLESAPKPDMAALLLPLAGPDIFSATPSAQRPGAAVQTIRTLVSELHLISRGRLPRSLDEAGWNEASVVALSDHLKREEER